MNDERLGRATGEWLRDIETPPPDSEYGVQRAMTQVAHNEQTRSRWPLPPLRRRGRATTEPPNVTGRTRPMLSPVTAITTGALIFAAGGALLVAQADQTETTPAGAEAPLQEPSAFEGRILYASTVRDSSRTEIRDGVDEGIDGMWNYRVVTISDPRLDGAVTLNGNVHEFADLGADVWSSSIRIENDGGAWQKEPSLVVRFDDVSGSASTVLLVGDGDYEGLVAVTELAADLTDPQGLSLIHI